MGEIFDDTMKDLLWTEAIKYKNKQEKKQLKINRVYEDDTWVIDLIDGNIRVSYFEDYHFVDEIILTKDSFKEEE